MLVYVVGVSDSRCCLVVLLILRFCMNVVRLVVLIWCLWVSFLRSVYGLVIEECLVMILVWMIVWIVLVSIF